jgi:hypothetical protein
MLVSKNGLLRVEQNLEKISGFFQTVRSVINTNYGINFIFLSFRVFVNTKLFKGRVVDSPKQDCGSVIFFSIPDRGSNNNKKRRGEKLVSSPFFVAINFSKLSISLNFF